MTSTIYLLTNKTVSEMNTQELILELFRKEPSAIYKNQQAIVRAIKDTLSVSRRQTAVSKALKKIGNHPINYRGEIYHIIRISEGYKLYRKNDVLSEATQEFAEMKVFENHHAYSVTKNIIAYTVKEKYHSFVIDYMQKSFDEHAFFDIISHGNKIYFLLMPETNHYKTIFNLPEVVHEIEKNNQKKTLTATRVIEKKKK